MTMLAAFSRAVMREWREGRREEEEWKERAGGVQCVRNIVLPEVENVQSTHNTDDLG
jgi:hypothetical protein